MIRVLILALALVSTPAYPAVIKQETQKMRWEVCTQVIWDLAQKHRYVARIHSADVYALQFEIVEGSLIATCYRQTNTVVWTTTTDRF